MSLRTVVASWRTPIPGNVLTLAMITAVRSSFCESSPLNENCKVYFVGVHITIPRGLPAKKKIVHGVKPMRVYVVFDRAPKVQINAATSMPEA